jgi:hypothetical protein
MGGRVGGRFRHFTYACECAAAGLYRSGVIYHTCRNQLIPCVCALLRAALCITEKLFSIPLLRLVVIAHAALLCIFFRRICFPSRRAPNFNDPS